MTLSKYLIFLSLFFSSNSFANFGEVFKDATVYNLSTVVDYSTLESFNTEAASLWSQMVHEAGSEQNAYVKMYNEPSPQLVQLHENLLQMILSSQFNNRVVAAYFREGPSYDYAHKTGRQIHPLLREIAGNVRNYLTQRLEEVLSSRRVAGWIFKNAWFEINAAIFQCTFYKCASFPDFEGKFNNKDLAIFRAWVYADIITTFDLATWKCDRYINPQSTQQDIRFANSDYGNTNSSAPRDPFLGQGAAPRSFRASTELTMLIPVCINEKPHLSAVKTPAERGQMYLKGTRLLD